MKKILLVSICCLFFVCLTGCGAENINLHELEYKDEITFGHYNGEDLDWIVLEDNNAPDDTVLLISKHIIEIKRLNEERKDVSWEASTLNKWLNTEFINTAFNDEIRQGIIVNKDAGEVDKITILSSSQVDLFLHDDNLRKPYSLSHVYNKDVLVWWYWTKTKCKKDNEAYETVNVSEGWIRTGGIKVDDDESGVRPAFWIKRDTVIKKENLYNWRDY